MAEDSRITRLREDLQRIEREDREQRRRGPTPCGTLGMFVSARRVRFLLKHIDALQAELDFLRGDGHIPSPQTKPSRLMRVFFRREARP